MKTTVAEMNEAKASKWLEKLVSTDFGIMTRRDFYTNYGIGKSTNTQKYASRKINGCYAELAKPKTTYQIVTSEKGQTYYYDCPKYVWDSLLFAVVD